MTNFVHLIQDLTFQEHMASYNMFSIQSTAAVDFSFSCEHSASQFSGFQVRPKENKETSIDVTKV